MRIDQLLVQRGLASSRSQAQRLIADGVQWQQGARWQRVAKNGDEVPHDAPLRLLNVAEARYVSRGGLKLESALRAVGGSASGWLCLDVGQSTGGFTDCLLQHGVAGVLGLDVGHGQLHPRLRADARVVALEGVNARAPDASKIIAAYDCLTGATGQNTLESMADDPAPLFDALVLDVSFISQTLVLPAVLPWLKAGGVALLLVKPQFELQPGQVGKGGLVREPRYYAEVEQRLRLACAAHGLHDVQWLDSPIAGGDGNREFFIAARKAGTGAPAPTESQEPL
jgi:23S rRNA (cytidine1920-2'-O)/16S rRNA (cytidine1409-2'-O)-methyltransferase